ncbi:MAG: YqjK-like family protein [Candidatus Accumulibacter sp.]|jgi:hypothetical protein|nr:YqjK-like family protein [Accumulibacter sp.]
MNRRIDELFLRRGRLIERIAGQREALRRDFKPVTAALGKADLAVAGVRAGVEYLRRHALVASAVAGVFLIFKGKAALRWAGWAFSLWKSWRALNKTLLKLRDSVRS